MNADAAILRFRLPAVRIALAMAIALASSHPAFTLAQEEAKPSSLTRQIYQCFDQQDYAKAIALIEAHLQEAPNDSVMLYNLACAKCRLGDHDGAATALFKAFQAGLRDIDHLRRDPDLAPLRGHPIYKKILEKADRAAAEIGSTALERWRAAYGTEQYRYETDDARRINYATALDESSHAEMRRMLERQADQLQRTLFKHPPTHFVLIAVPTPEDSDKYFKGQDHIGGIYRHSRRELVARDIGGSLRHEFVHALHFADMDRLRQPHPLWIQEGLAALYEDYDIMNDGSFRFLPNERQIVIKARVKAGRAIKWPTMMDLTGEQFMDRSQALYPQVRSIFEFLADQGLLEKWYETYTANFNDDRSGAKAFEMVFGRPVAEVERQWRAWVLKQPEIDLHIRPNDAALGIRSRENASNDGVLITYVVPQSAAARAGLKRGDVIVSVDRQNTPTLVALRKVVAAKSVGDQVEVKARRNGAYLTVQVKLRPAY